MTYLDETKKAYSLNGRTYPRVTGILASIAKPMLVPAAVKVTTEHIRGLVEAPFGDLDWLDVKREYRRQWDRKRDTGTAVHAAVSSAIAGEPLDPDLSDEQHAILDQFYHWRRAYAPYYVASEFAVFSDTHNYAGTADMVAVIGGRSLLIDIKTGKDVWPDVALQLAAYANADFYMIGGHRETRGFDGWAVLHLRPDGFALREVREEYRDLAWRRFVALRDYAYWQSEGAKVDAVFDEALLPTETFIPEEVA